MSRLYFCKMNTIKKLTFITLVTLASLSLFAQDDSSEPKKVADDVKRDVKQEVNDPSPKNKFWYLYASGTAGKSSADNVNGKYEGGKIGLEIRPIPHIGIGFSAGATNLTLKSNSTIFDYLYPLALISASNQDNTSVLYLAYVATEATKSHVLSYNQAQIDFNFHINGERFIDPYVGFGIIGGKCSGGGGTGCNLLGTDLRLGLQLNFDYAFIFLQGHYQSLTFTSTGDQSGIKSNLTSNLGSFGAGVRF
jgi:hypothetical protein